MKTWSNIILSCVLCVLSVPSVLAAKHFREPIRRQPGRSTTFAPAAIWNDFSSLEYHFDMSLTNESQIIPIHGSNYWNMSFLPDVANGPRRVTVTDGYAYDFNIFSNQYFSTAERMGGVTLTAVSFSVWFNMRSLNYQQIVLFNGLKDGASYGMYYQPNLTGMFAYVFDYYTYGFAVTPTSLIQTNTWYLLNCSWCKDVNGGVPEIYVQGLQQTPIYTNARTDAVVIEWNTIRAIGATLTGVLPFDGQIGDVMTYTNRVITSNEQFTIWNAQRYKYGL